MINGIHHVSLLITDLSRALDFYSNVLKLEQSSSRPALDFEGAWFELGEQQIHLICTESESLVGRHASRCGRDRHTAFTVSDIDALVGKLTEANIEFERSRSGRPAVFCRDPDGNALEFIGSA